MIRSLAISASSMRAEAERVAIISNNLANSATTGFKRARGVTASFGDTLQLFWGNTPAGVVIMGGARPASLTNMQQAWVSMEQGPSHYTGDDLNVDIDGPGFFTLETPNGERYTRDGRFRVDAEGWLVSTEGYRVLGSQGPVQTGGGIVSIDRQGNVVADGKLVGSISVVGFANPNQLQQEQGGLYRASAASGLPETLDTLLSPGFVEESNVNVMMEMADLIAATRVYEMNQKAIWAQDEMLGKAVNDVGRVG